MLNNDSRSQIEAESDDEDNKNQLIESVKKLDTNSVRQRSIS